MQINDMIFKKVIPPCRNPFQPLLAVCLFHLISGLHLKQAQTNRTP